MLQQVTIGIIDAQAATSEMNLTDLIVEGNENRSISDVTLKIEGVIEVRDNASLSLENVKVRFIESEIRHSFTVNGNASLVLIESDIERRIDVNNNGRLIASKSKLYYSHYCTIHEYNHTYGGVTANHDSNIILTACNVGYLWLHNNSQSRVSNSFIYWSFQEGKNLTVKDSEIQVHREILKNIENDLVIPDFIGYSGDLGEILPGSTSHFENVSLIDGLWLLLRNSNIVIHDSEFYFVDVWKDSNLQLNNVTLSRVGNYWTNCNLSIIDCNIEHMFSYGSNDTITITGSTLSSIDLQSRNLELEISDSIIDELLMEDTWFYSFKAYISDSTIGVFYPGLGEEEPNEYDMNNVTILKGLGFRRGTYSSTGGLNLHGGIRFGDDFVLNKTTVTGYAIINREYLVSCTSSGGPVDNVSLVAVNDNNTLWEGKSNPEGIAMVPIRFENIFKVIQPNNTSGPTLIQADNMTETFTLLWNKGDDEGLVELGLTSDTPVRIEITNKTGIMSLLLPLSAVLLIILVIFIVKQEMSRRNDQSIRSPEN